MKQLRTNTSMGVLSRIWKSGWVLSLLGILFEMRLHNLRINFIAEFCPHLGSFLLFSSLRFGQISRLQDSAFLSEVAVNHLKTARGETWPKRIEKNNKKLPRWGQKSAIKLILWMSQFCISFRVDSLGKSMNRFLQPSPAAISKL